MTILTYFFALIHQVPALPLAPRAYIDPNTGGMLFQMLAVILALFSGFVFFFSRQIKTFFARVRRKMRGEPEPAPEEVIAPPEKDEEA